MNINHTFRQPAARRRSVAPCRHQKLIRLPDSSHRLQCRHCRSLLPPDAPRTSFCPVCWAHDAMERRDFMETNIIDVSFAPYRCEDCGLMIRAQ